MVYSRMKYNITKFVLVVLFSGYISITLSQNYFPTGYEDSELYKIPQDLPSNKERVQVTFQALSNNQVPVYGKEC